MKGLVIIYDYTKLISLYHNNPNKAYHSHFVLINFNVFFVVIRSQQWQILYR